MISLFFHYFKKKTIERAESTFWRGRFLNLVLILHVGVKKYNNIVICWTIPLYFFFRTAWKVPKYGAFYGPYFFVFSANTGKYGPEKTPYLDTFDAVSWYLLLLVLLRITSNNMLSKETWVNTNVITRHNAIFVTFVQQLHLSSVELLRTRSQFFKK